METPLDGSGAPTPAEFHQAISRYSARWYGACLKITKSRELAEDAVQDALISAWNKRRQFQRSAQLETWIHRIAINAALQLLRRRRPDPLEPAEDCFAGDEPGPERVHADAELNGQLQQALTGLSEVERVCFVLKHLEQWKLKEIAAQLQTNENRVKQAIFRAARKLCASLAHLRSEPV